MKKIMEQAFLTTFPLSLDPHLCYSKPNFILSPAYPPRLSSHLRRTITPCNYRRWDSISAVEDDRKKKRRRRQWWSDISSSSESNSGILEELVDSIWIFKVFGLYGWWLPPVLLSLLLATGPKAFFSALAVPIGQSIVTLAFSKLWGLIDDPKRRFKAKKRRQRGKTTRNIDTEKEEEEEGEEGEEEEEIRREYRSWVLKDDGKSDKGNEDSYIFRGWDELDRVKEFDEGTLRREGRSRRQKRFIRRERGGETPLLLRLLVAVFPFLGSWTKML